MRYIISLPALLSRNLSWRGNMNLLDRFLPGFFSNEEIQEMEKELLHASSISSEAYDKFMAEEIVRQTLKNFFKSVNEEFFDHNPKV
jgi:hypothetical protein